MELLPHQLTLQVVDRRRLISKMTRAEEHRNLIEIRNQVRDLKNHPGYSHIELAINENMKLKMRELVSSPVDLQTESTRTYVAGEVNSLMFFRDFLETYINSLTQQIEAIALTLTGDEDE